MYSLPTDDFRQYINGELVSGRGRTTQIRCPGNGEPVAQIALATKEQAQQALDCLLYTSGPVAYNLGNEQPVVTDANLVLGRINPHYVLGGRLKIDAQLSRAAMKKQIADPMGLSVEAAAQGVISVVNSNMARAMLELTTLMTPWAAASTESPIGSAICFFMAARDSWASIFSRPPST